MIGPGVVEPVDDGGVVEEVVEEVHQDHAAPPPG